MEDMSYAEWLRRDYKNRASERIRFHMRIAMYYINDLKEEGVSQREIEELTGIQIKRDHICIFDNFEDSK